MGMLIDEVPTSVLIDGVSYEINWDFRYSVMFETLMLDPSVSDEEKLVKALNLYYPVIPTNIDVAVDKILWFYQRGHIDTEKSKGKGKGGKTKRVYDYAHDDAYIYSAFLDQYGVDLQDDQIHWWKFKAMFEALSNETEFVKIMGYRSIKITNSMTKSQREFYTDMKRIHALPQPKCEVQKTKAIEEALLNGGDLSAFL